MNLPPEAPKCPRCSTLLPADAPDGLCPKCLMALNLGTETDFAGEAGAAESRSALPPEELASLFPGFELLECLGRGGMGVVYKARQKSLGRLVALKLVAPERAADPRFAARFEKEARALAALNHPNIVTVHDHGRAGGHCFFVMEYVDGVTLRGLLTGGRISTREALAIVPQICDALQYAHDQGIVHRDIKPENILLDRRGRVKVADFGLAKLVAGPSDAPVLGDEAREPGTASAGDLTDAGRVMGTPHYMSPEQIQTPGEVDHRADIYALGVVFYQMLTGELPDKKLQPPSRKVRIDVRLDEVVLRALEENPGRRYANATEFKTRVENVNDDAGPPVTVSSPPPGSAAQKSSDAETVSLRPSGQIYGVHPFRLRRWWGVFTAAGVVIFALFLIDARNERKIAPRAAVNEDFYRGIPQESARQATALPEVPGVHLFAPAVTPGDQTEGPPAPSFGPVMERMLEPTNPDRRALNLAFGNFISPGPGRRLDFSAAGADTLRAAGADLYAPEGGSPGVLSTLDMRLCVGGGSSNQEDFDSLTAEQLEHVLARMQNWRENMEAVLLAGVDFRPATTSVAKGGLYLFITRNDVKGALQVFDDSQGVMIRYKLVHNPVAQVAAPAALPSSPPKEVLAPRPAPSDPQARFGQSGEITIVARAENRDRLVGYRLKENAEIAVPKALGRFTDSSGWGYSPELKAWARANHVDMLFHFGEKSIEIIQLDLCDGFVGQASTWDSVSPAQAWLALKEAEAKESTPPAATLGGWGYRDDRRVVCVYRTRDGDVGIYQLRGLDSDRARGVEIRRKQILSPETGATTP